MKTESHKPPIYMFLLRPIANMAVPISCVLMLLSSFFLPGVMTFRTGGHGYEEISSLTILAIGWMAPITLTPQFAWYATPLFFIATYYSLRRHYELANHWSKLSLITASNTFLWFVWPIPGDEGGVTRTYLKYPLSGFIIWYLSIAILAAFNSILLKQSTK